VKRGTFQVPADGGRVISRIHVDDLADHLIAGLNCTLTGAFPIADEEPCPSIDVAVLTAQLLNLPVPAASSMPPAAGRRVDGSAYRHALGLTLRYPSYRQGIPACLAAEACYTISQ
jgi:nucleoside-diphosphate-sugar epimerase